MHVNPGTLVATLTGDCASGPQGPGATYLDVLFDQFAGPLARAPREEVDSHLASMQGELSPQPVLAADLREAGNRAGAAVTDAFTAFKSTLTCDAINTGVAHVHDSVCCDFFEALYWALASWYLISFAVCLCGCPAGVFSLKRLAPLKHVEGDSFVDYSVLPDTAAQSPIRRAQSGYGATGSWGGAAAASPAASAAGRGSGSGSGSGAGAGGRGGARDEHAPLLHGSPALPYDMAPSMAQQQQQQAYHPPGSQTGVQLAQQHQASDAQSTGTFYSRPLSQRDVEPVGSAAGSRADAPVPMYVGAADAVPAAYPGGNGAVMYGQVPSSVVAYARPLER